MKRQLLYSPVEQLADEKLIGIPAIHGVHRPELLRQFAGPSELPEHTSVEFHSVDLTVIQIRWIVRIGTVEILVRARRNADRPGRSDAGQFALEGSIVVEHLNAFIPP